MMTRTAQAALALALVAAAMLAGCTPPETVTRVQLHPSPIDTVAAARLSGTYR